MMRLLRAEVARLLTRRFTLLALLGLLAGIALFQVAVFVAASPPNPAEVAENQARFEYALAEWQEDHDEYVQRCVDQGGTPQVCAANWPQPQAEDYGLAATPFAEIGAVAALLAVLMAALTLFVLAASFIGAEFTTGAIANWLSFVPRRGAVFAAKIVAIVIFTVVVSALASALTLGIAALISSAYGGDLTTLGQHAGTAARGLLVVTIIAVLGFCAGLVTRHTAAALGVLLGYLLLWVLRNGILQNAAWAQRLTPWSAEGNLSAILGNGHTYAIPEQRLTDRGLETEFLERTLSLSAGLLYWAVVLTVVVTGSVLIFRRRDVG